MRYLTTKNRAILREVIHANFKVRYQGSVLGYLWSLLKPLFMFAILYVVFTQVFKLGNDIQHYPVYLLLGIVLWNFFTETTVTGLSSIVSSGELIRKISIPRYLIVIATTASAFINLVLSLIVVFVFALLNHVEFHPQSFLAILLIAELVIASLGISLFLAASFVRFRDINYIWELVLQAGFYLTPIIYPLQKVPNEFFQKLLLMNPIAQVIQDMRAILVTDGTITAWSFQKLYLILIPMVLSVLLFIGGAWYFKKKSNTFAENV